MLTFKEYMEQKEGLLQEWPEVKPNLFRWSQTDEDSDTVLGKIKGPLTLTELLSLNSKTGLVGRVSNGKQTIDIHLPTLFIPKGGVEAFYEALATLLEKSGSLKLYGRAGVRSETGVVYPRTFAYTASEKGLVDQERKYKATPFLIVSVNGQSLSDLATIGEEGEEGGGKSTLSKLVNDIQLKVQQHEAHGHFDVDKMRSSTFPRYEMITSSNQPNLVVLVSSSTRPGEEAAIYILPATLDLIKNDHGTISHDTVSVEQAIQKYDNAWEDEGGSRYLKALIDPGGPLRPGSQGYQKIVDLLDENVELPLSEGPRTFFEIYVTSPSGKGGKRQGRVVRRTAGNRKAILDDLDKFATGRLKI